MRYSTLAAKTFATLTVLGMLAAAPAFAQSTAPATPAPASKMAPAPAATKAPAATPAATKATDLMDINTATEAQLSTLPGIAEARSKAIIAGRPYKGKDELLQKKIIPENVYNGIKDQIIARQKS